MHKLTYFVDDWGNEYHECDDVFVVDGYEAPSLVKYLLDADSTAVCINHPTFNVNDKYVIFKNVIFGHRWLIKKGLIKKNHNHKIVVINLTRKRYQKKHGLLD